MILRTITRNLLRSNRTLLPPLKAIDYVVCIDIECTCDDPVQTYPMEVIEIACLKLDLTKLNKVNRMNNTDASQLTFHNYVRPLINPNLTLFCQNLTGILQPTIDESETIDKIIGKFLKWLQKVNLIDDNCEKKENFALASCGNFDLKLLSPIIRDCQFNNNLELPIYFKEWINVKKTFVNHKREWPRSLYHMMELLGEEPSGRLHSAMDDCKNLARVVECLHLDGCKFRVTNKLYVNDKPQLELRDL